MAKYKDEEKMNLVNVTFGKYIEIIRKKKGMTQEKVAVELGVTQSIIDRWEKGKRNVDLKLAVRICAVLDGNIKDFIDNFSYYSVL